MAKESAEIKKRDREALKSHKMRPLFWVVVREMDTILICKNRVTGEFRCISK